MTLLRDLIDIPTSVGESDFVVKAAEGADLDRYVVTDQLRESFDQALRRIGHAIATGRSQAMFLHGSFGSGKSHFMAVLREILAHNPQAREIRKLAEPVIAADPWLPGKRILTLTCHMLDADSVEQAVLQAYLRQVTALHPEEPVPAVHRSDALLSDADGIRRRMGDEAFFAALREGPVQPAGSGGAGGATPGLAALRVQRTGWTPDLYAEAAAEPPGTERRDTLVSALTATFFTGAVRSAEYLDLDTGLAVVTRHAVSLGYDAIVLFLDEMILWLSGKISDHVFVNTEGAKLNKLVESADASRPLPLVSFVARQRNLEEFLGPQVGGTERQALADVMRSAQGRFGEIVLADTNLPEITEGRLLRPVDDAARDTIDRAFAAVRGNRAIWDILLLGAQYGDAGIGSDAAAFRKLYPFSPALVATLVALSQALQRERTAVRVMTELLVQRRDTLRVNDLIGVAALVDPLVLHGELPDRPALKQLFQAARTLYQTKLRKILLTLNGITEEQAAGHTQFQLDDKLIKTVLLGALVPEVPALHNLTAAKLHALNFGSITSPIPGYENTLVLGRLKKIAQDAGELHLTDDPDPVVTLKLHTVDFDKLLDLVPHQETSTGVRQQLLRELVTAEMGLAGGEGSHGELLQPREWRGRRHYVQVKFGNVRDRNSMPDAALVATGEAWRIVVDYPFDPEDRPRSDDRARVQSLPRNPRTVFWLPRYLTDDMMSRLAQLAKVNYLLGSGGTGDRIDSLAADWPKTDRQQGKVYLQQRQAQLRNGLVEALKQAYGAAAVQPAEVLQDPVGVLHTLADGLRLGDPRGGTLRDAFHNLTGDLLDWAYPGRPALPVEERPVSRAELDKVLGYARQAAADPTHGVVVPQADQRTVRRICNNLQLGELLEHRYVLDMSTCWWSRYLLQEAAALDHTDRFPVRELRAIVAGPETKRRGFDPELESLIIAVFAQQQQLGWYDQYGGKVNVDSVAAIRDEYELRHPPMPDAEAWTAAAKRGQELFGEVLPVFRSPANLGRLAGPMRQVARRYVDVAAQLRDELTRRAELLGLDPAASTGRLASVNRVARLLHAVANETDDVVLVELVAGADLGNLDELGASQVFKQGQPLIDTLGRTQWRLLKALAARARTDEPARLAIERLRLAARHEHHAADLVVALERATDEAAQLLADVPTVPPQPGGSGAAGGPGTQAGPGPQGGSGSAGGPGAGVGSAGGAGGLGSAGGNGASGGADQVPGPAGGTPGGGVVLVDPRGGAAVHPQGGPATGRDLPGTGPTVRRYTVSDEATWAGTAEEIRAEIAAGRQVTVTVEIR
ncbi:phage resistance protein [Plantactinospora sp. WMMB334]|uniref:phage resistance protein n=1 Tax=Plantactinospora sp. WMMB334 TaxID=3404119 RepID=UPI003B93BC89